MYVIVQLGGGICGAVLGRLIGGKAVVPMIGGGNGLLQAFLAEAIFTGLFILTILCVVPKSGQPHPYFGAAIGLALFVAVGCTASISGGSINPSVAVSLVLVGNLTKLHYALWVSFANAVGAIAGVIVYFLVDNGEDKSPETILREIRSKILHPKAASAGGSSEAAPLISA